MTLLDPYGMRHGVLMLEDVSFEAIAAQVGTPTYVYSRRAMSEVFLRYQRALGARAGLICYAVKANSNLAVLDCLARLGAGFDIVSGGELARVLAAGGRADKVIFSGVGKTVAEMEMALKAKIRCFNLESMSELERLDQVAGRLGVRAPVSLRVNPDVDAKTHPYISTGLKESKFGIAFADAFNAYRRAHAAPHLDVVGIDCHIGSQLTEVGPLYESLDRLCDLIDQLDEVGIKLSHLDLGGGIGVRYKDETTIDIEAFVTGVAQRVDAWRARRHEARPIELLFEPGRSIVANAGTLLTRVEYLKRGAKNFAVVDAAMNDLIRPALYNAWHEVVLVAPARADSVDALWDVVGPICESGDWLARDRALHLSPGVLLAILSAGAYAMGMASNYNTRGRPAEVMVDGSDVYVVRERESIESLFALESRIPR